MIFTTGAYSQVVTTNADAGPGSLRDAILFANANPGTFITFNITGSATITLATPLPAITESTTIQGYSQPGSVIGPIGASRTIVVELNCNNTVGNGLNVQADGVTISGMAIFRAGGNGISLGAGFSTLKVWGCYIGTNATGTATGLGNAQNGVQIGDVSNVSSSVVIGSEGDQQPPFGPFDGSDADEGNVIVANGSAGPTVFFSGILLSSTTAARISGNYIGIGANGTTAIGNGLAGIGLMDGSFQNVIGVDDATSTQSSQVNFIGNNRAGIILFGNSNNNIISGNFVGVTPGNTNAGNNGGGFPLLGPGIMIWGSSSNIIGTNANGIDDALEANTVGFNFIGVFIEAIDQGVPFPPNANDATDNRVWGNFIGTDAAGTADFGNTLYGVAIRADQALNASSNFIGADDVDPSLAAVEGNVIKNNAVGGVATGLGGGATGTANLNRISHNSFTNNRRAPGPVPGLSIANTFNTAPQPNDCGDADGGGNNQLNRPVIESAVSDANTLIIKGWAAPGSTIEFYITTGMTSFSQPFYIVPLSMPFGELTSHLITLVEGDDGSQAGVADGDATTSAYPDDGIGVSCTENRFSFTIPIASLIPGFDGTTTHDIGAIVFDALSGPANTSEGSFRLLSVLPVSLTDFTGKLVEGKTQLKWVTASENNSHHFEVERSVDGAHYGSIGQVAAKGNSTMTSNYGFTDGAPVKGLNYYRLKQVDKDGKFVYSGVVVIRNNGAFVKAQIIPNPVHNMATISIMLAQKEDLQVRVIDASGKLARSYKFTGNNGENQFLLNDLGNLPTGVYTVDIRGQQTSIQQKLMKY